MASMKISGGAVLRNNITFEMADTADPNTQVHGETRPSAPSNDFDYGSEIVTVKVGTWKTEYYIHKHVLTSRSTYFNDALNSDTNVNSFELPSDDEAIFKLLINWLYTGSATTPGGSSPFPRDLFQLWILADSKTMLELQNYCIDAIPGAIVSNWGKNKTNWANSGFVKWVWSTTSATSRLREFLVEMYAVSVKASTIASAPWPPNFLVRLLKRIGDAGSQGEGPLGPYFGDFRKTVLENFKTSSFHGSTGEVFEQLPSYEDACTS